MKLRTFIDRLHLTPRGELFATAAIIALCVAGPTVGMLVYMNRSLQGERHSLIAQRSAARRASLGEAREGMLRSIDAKLHAVQSDPVLPTLKPGRAFGHVMLRDWADGCLVLDKNGVIAFPIPAQPVPEAKLTKADTEAAELIEQSNTDAAKLGRPPSADEWLALAGKLGTNKLSAARSASGRLFLPSVQFSALELLPREHPRFATTVSALSSSVHDYTGRMPTPQRVFLWQELKRFGDAGEMPWASAEQFSADAAVGWDSGAPPGQLGPVKERTGILQLRLEKAPVVLLFRADRLQSELGKFATGGSASRGFDIEFGPVSDGEPLTRLAMGRQLPGWELRAVGSENLSDIDSILRRRRIYLLLGTLAGAALATMLAAAVIRRVVLGARTTQMRQEFLSTVSHELRTPLTSIRMFVDTLASGPIDDSESTRTYLDIIKRENERLSRLVENFLAFSRLESGRTEFQLESIAPSEIANDAQSALAARLALPGCEFTANCEPGLPVVHVDQAAMSSAVLNLIENALKYTGEQKRVSLDVARDGDGVVFSVTDNGHGIPPAELKRLGERFHRATAGRGAPAGFGLGLSIVRAIAEGHGGRVTVESTEGRGSIFRIHLPPAPKNSEP